MMIVLFLVRAPRDLWLINRSSGNFAFNGCIWQLVDGIAHQINKPLGTICGMHETVMLVYYDKRAALRSSATTENGPR